MLRPTATKETGVHVFLPWNDDVDRNDHQTLLCDVSPSRNSGSLQSRSTNSTEAVLFAELILPVVKPRHLSNIYIASCLPQAMSARLGTMQSIRTFDILV